MNTHDIMIELTEHEQAAIAGGGDSPTSTISSWLNAGAAAIAGAASYAWNQVIGQASSMEAAGYTMSTSEAGYVAVGALTAPEAGLAAGLAADAVLVTDAAQAGAGACQALSTLAGQYQAQGQSFFSSWVNAIADGIAGPSEADYY